MNVNLLQILFLLDLVFEKETDGYIFWKTTHFLKLWGSFGFVWTVVTHKPLLFEGKYSVQKMYLWKIEKARVM